MLPMVVIKHTCLIHVLVFVKSLKNIYSANREDMPARLANALQQAQKIISHSEVGGGQHACRRGHEVDHRRAGLAVQHNPGYAVAVGLQRRTTAAIA